MLCRDGVIDAAGPVAAIKPLLQPDTTIADYSGCLIAPGFIDTHIHYVQTGVIGSQAKDLLDWLERYTFIAEQAFADPQIAASTARIFCEELLRKGQQPRWCSARCMRARSMRCSPRPPAAIYA